MSLKIVFMGTPEFAVESLRAIHASEHEVVGVVTVADKPAGRGKKLRPSPVKVFAEENGLPILQPVKLRDEEFLDALKAWNADVFVVVAFRMLPKQVWMMPSQGTINLHGSLLPDYRGAAPIHWAVINGETETGCTTFLIDEEIDTGGMLQKHVMSIGPNETTGEVHDRMMVEGAQLLVETLNGIEQGTHTPVPQKDTESTKHAPKIHKEDMRIDWGKDAQTVHNFIRGMSPFPGAWTTIDDQTFKIFRSLLSEMTSIDPVGHISQSGKTIHVTCGDGNQVELLMVQAPGKKRMDTASFSLGNDLDGKKFI